MPRGDRDIKELTRQIQDEQGIKYTQARRQAMAMLHSDQATESGLVENLSNAMLPRFEPDGNGWRFSSENPASMDLIHTSTVTKKAVKLVRGEMEMGASDTLRLEVDRKALDLSPDDDQWMDNLIMQLIEDGVSVNRLGTDGSTFILSDAEDDHLIETFSSLIGNFVLDRQNEVLSNSDRAHSIWTSIPGDQVQQEMDKYLAEALLSNPGAEIVRPSDGEEQELRADELLQVMSDRYREMRGRGEYKWSGQPLILALRYDQETLRHGPLRELLRKGRAAGIFIYAFTSMEMNEVHRPRILDFMRVDGKRVM